MADIRLENRDWRLIKKRAEAAVHLLDNQMVCDCQFMLGDDEKVIGAHRSFLVMASPVFEAMFCGSLSYSPSEPTRIPDVEYDDFQDFLRYVYSGAIGSSSFNHSFLRYIYSGDITIINFNHACDVGYIAKKYMVPVLLHLCCKYMALNVRSETTWNAFELGNLYEDESLKFRSMNFIRCKTEDALADPSFVNISKVTLVTLLQEEKLNISELGLFNAVRRWLENHDTQDVQQVLQHIRFLNMTLEEFSGGPAISRLLTQEQVFTITAKIKFPNKCLPMPGNFSTSKATRNLCGVEIDPDPISGRSRCIRHHEVQVPVLNRGILDSAVTFTVDRSVWIHSLIIASQEVPSGSLRSETYSLTLYCHLLDKDGTRLTYIHSTKDISYGQSTICVEFNKPVYVQKNFPYRIFLVYHQPGYYNEATASNFVISQGVQFNFSNFVRVEHLFKESIRDGFIRGLEFSF